MNDDPAFIAAKCGDHKRLGVDHYVAQCPAHPDKNPSLDITKKNGKAVWICRAGCLQAEVTARLQAIGALPKRESDPRDTPETVYDYCDEQGAMLFQVHRRRRGERKIFCKPSQDPTKAGSSAGQTVSQACPACGMCRIGLTSWSRPKPRPMVIRPSSTSSRAKRTPIA
jgi:hypothetical protein